MPTLIVETPPLVEPLTLAEVKNQLHLGPYDDSDHANSAITASRLRGLIAAAREYVETFTGRSFVAKGYVQYLDGFPYYADATMPISSAFAGTMLNYSQGVKLLVSPLISVEYISYIDNQTGRAKSLTIGLGPWFPFSAVVVGRSISDVNGNVQTCTTAGKTGAVEPVWPAGAGVTTDGTAVWTGAGVPAPASAFVVDATSQPPRLFPLAGQSWPSVLYAPSAVGIHFTAGNSTDASNVPNSAKVAMRQLVALWDREPDAKVPDSINRLLWSLRILDFAPTRG